MISRELCYRKIVLGMHRILAAVPSQCPVEEVEPVRYLTTSFNPSMLAGGSHAKIRECRLRDAQLALERDGVKSAVSGSLAADIMSKLVDRDIRVNNEPVMLRPGDELYCIVPGYEPSEGIEATVEEVKEAGCRAFKVTAERAAVTINE